MYKQMQTHTHTLLLPLLTSVGCSQSAVETLHAVQSIELLDALADGRAPVVQLHLRLDNPDGTGTRGCDCT